MPDFAAHSLEPAAARVEVAELRTLLVENADLKESVVRNSFRERLNASALIGHYNPAVQLADRLAFEFPLFGDFRCDLAIGDSVSRSCTFVEFEAASPRSLECIERGAVGIERGRQQLADRRQASTASALAARKRRSSARRRAFVRRRGCRVGGRAEVLSSTDVGGIGRK
jgi:hypothetical protein